MSLTSKIETSDLLIITRPRVTALGFYIGARILLKTTLSQDNILKSNFHMIIIETFSYDACEKT